MALAMIAPTPGIDASRRVFFLSLLNSPRDLVHARSRFRELPGEQVDCFHRVGRHRLRSRFQKCLDMLHPERRDDPEFRKMRTDRVHDLRHLPDQQVARPVLQQDGLMCLGLDRHEAHRRSCDRFADRGGIGSICLLAPNIRLHIVGRHQADVVPERDQLPRPGMRTSTGFDPDKAHRQFGEEPDNLCPAQLPLQHHQAIGIDPVKLEHVLRNIEADRSDRVRLCFFIANLPMKIPMTKSLPSRTDGSRGHPRHQWGRVSCIKLADFLGRVRYNRGDGAAREFDRRAAEFQVPVAVLNSFTALGIPLAEAAG